MYRTENDQKRFLLYTLPRRMKGVDFLLLVGHAVLGASPIGKTDFREDMLNSLDFSGIGEENQVAVNMDHQLKTLQTRARFTSFHEIIIKEILLHSEMNETQLEVFARASDAFKRANLCLIGFSSFSTHMRRLKSKTRVPCPVSLSVLPSQLEALEQFRDSGLKFDQACSAIKREFQSRNIPLINKRECKKIWNSLRLGAGRLKITRSHIRILENLVSQRHHFQGKGRHAEYKKACRLFSQAGLGPISMRVFIEHYQMVQRKTLSADFGGMTTDQPHQPSDYSNDVVHLSDFNSENVVPVDRAETRFDVPHSAFNIESAHHINFLPVNCAQESIQSSDCNSGSANLVNLLPSNSVQETISFPNFNSEMVQETISFPNFNSEMVQQTTLPSDFNSESANYITLLPVNFAYLLDPSETTEGATSDANHCNLLPLDWADLNPRYTGNEGFSHEIENPIVPFQSREEAPETRWTFRHWEILINLVRSGIIFDLGCMQFTSRLHQEGLRQVEKSECEEAWEMLTSLQGHNDNTVRSKINYALHDRIIKSFLRGSEEAREPSDMYAQVSALFESAELPRMSMRLFNAHCFSLQCELENEMVEDNPKRCYSSRHRKIVKEIVIGNPDMTPKNIFRLATRKFAQEGLTAMTFTSLGPWVRQIKKVPKIAQKDAEAILTCIFNSNPKIRLPGAMNALRKFANLGGRIPSREEVSSWLDQRRKVRRFLF